MPKIKSKSGAKKRFRSTASGKILMSPAFKRHNMRKRSPKFVRQTRGTQIMHPSDAKIVRRWIPYA